MPDDSPDTTTPDTTKLIHRVQKAAALSGLVGSAVVSTVSFVAIVYFVITAQWIPAIFVLLARRELATAMDGYADRIIRNMRPKQATGQSSYFGDVWVDRNRS
jgi:hypothetical protein